MNNPAVIFLIVVLLRTSLLTVALTGVDRRHRRNSSVIALR
jgi:hypothetical protein